MPSSALASNLDNWAVHPELELHWDGRHVTAVTSGPESLPIVAELLPFLEIFAAPRPLREGVETFLRRYGETAAQPHLVAEAWAFVEGLKSASILVSVEPAARTSGEEVGVPVWEAPVTSAQDAARLVGSTGGGTSPPRGSELYDMVREHRPESCLELGFAHGVSTVYIAAGLEANGTGHLTSVDRPLARDLRPTAQDLVDRGLLGERVSLVYEETGYIWYLRGLLREQLGDDGLLEPCLDFVFMDGASTWQVDALAFLLADRLLKPGGWIVLDDIDWTWAHISDDDLKSVQRFYGDLGPAWQREVPQLRDVWELLARTDPGYTDFSRDAQRARMRKMPAALT